MAISVNDSVNEAAAKTFKLICAGVGVLPLPEVVEPPHAANKVQRATKKRNKRGKCFMGASLIGIVTILDRFL